MLKWVEFFGRFIDDHEKYVIVYSSNKYLNSIDDCIIDNKKWWDIPGKDVIDAPTYLAVIFENDKDIYHINTKYQYRMVELKKISFNKYLLVSRGEIYKKPKDCITSFKKQNQLNTFALELCRLH